MMEKKQIANIIFFIRHDEPRDPNLDLYGTFINQINLVKKYKFPASFLLQYDSLIDPKYVDALKTGIPEECEVGGWLEIVQPLVEKAGLKWRGREGFSWDWHANVGFTVGYTQDERRKMIDIFMEDFKSTFGFYPKSVGSWIIDGWSLNYMHEKYGIVGSCFCRDQWGTDGYTLWGGYYGQGYYPSKKNVFCPANSIEEQINVPTFRMLGSDPIYQYDFGLSVDDKGKLCPSADHGVATLEPVYLGGECGGGVPEWVTWFLNENFNPNTLTFNYCQVGQENSFGWEAMQAGLIDQFNKLDVMNKAGRVEFMTLEKAAMWYKENFKLTAATSITAFSDWKKEDEHRTVWYNCKNYRINFYAENDRFWIRDMHIFDDQYQERYYNEKCLTTYMQFDNLPVMDGNRWSGGSVRAGMYISDKDGNEPKMHDFQVEYIGDTISQITVNTTDGNRYIFTCDEDSFKIDGPVGFSLVMKAGNTADFSNHQEKVMNLVHNSYRYSVYLKNGKFKNLNIEKQLAIQSEDGLITFDTARRLKLC